MLGFGVFSASMSTSRRGWFKAPQPKVDRGVDQFGRLVQAQKL